MLFHVREGFEVRGLKVSLGRLETRLNCIKLAREQDTGERSLYTIQGRTWTSGYKGKTESSEERDSD